MDLVALDPRGVLVGLEVRARRSDRAGAPEETIDPRRVRRMARSLASFAVTAGVRHAGLRVDLVAARPTGDAQGRCLHLRRIPDISG